MLISADGKINEKELAVGKQMISAEGIAEAEFNVQLELLKSKDKSILLGECLLAIKKLDRKQQIRSIAWLCLVANGDGFMDKAEWQFIYRIYHQELNLPLNEIMATQKELNLMSHHKSLYNLNTNAPRTAIASAASRYEARSNAAPGASATNAPATNLPPVIAAAISRTRTLLASSRSWT